MITDGAGSTMVGTRGLVASLIPLIRKECGGRLSEVTWFKADWQRGGAATGSAIWRDDDGTEVPVIIKLPVGQRELRWTQRLQSDDPDLVVPRLLASGASISAYDLGWMIIEKFEHGPLGLHWHDSHIERISIAIARFHEATTPFEVDLPPRYEDWPEMVATAREMVRTNNVEDSAAWTGALKKLAVRLDDMVSLWRARPVNQWLHGDVHVANAMSRHAIDSGTVSLIDLAEVHAGHWVEDAIYLERQCWARPERLKPIKPMKAIGDMRRKLGLPVEDADRELAMIRRALLGATAPCFLKTEGNPKHLAACLQWLRTALSAG